MDGALYWTKEPGSLKGLIERAEAMTQEQMDEIGKKAKKRINREYSWEKITGEYEELFIYERKKII